MNTKPSGKNDSKSNKSNSKNNFEKINMLTMEDVNNFKTKLIASYSLGIYTLPFSTSSSLINLIA